MTVEALRRRQTHDGAAAVASGKQREKEKKNGGDAGLIARPGSKEKPRRSLPHTSAKLRTATRAPGAEKKAVGDEVASVATVHQIYRIAIRFKSQITPKFIWQLKNLQK